MSKLFMLIWKERRVFEIATGIPFKWRYFITKFDSSN